MSDQEWMDDPAAAEATKQVKKEIFDPSALGLMIGEVAGFSPQEMKSTYVQACQHMKAGQLKTAAKLFAMLCALEHNEGKNWRGLGLAMQRLGFVPVAEFAYNRALYLDPLDVPSRVFLAELMLKSRRAARARVECLQAIEDGRRLGKPDMAPYVKRGEKLLTFIDGTGAGEQTFER